MSKKLIQLVVFLIATAVAAHAQTTVKGRIVDQATGEGEPYVTYSILHANVPANADAKPVKITITDENGAFAETIDNGEYTIIFSTLGKKDLELSISAAGEPIDLGELNMEDDEQLLKEASVTALRPLVKMEVDKMTYNVEDDVDSKSMTMLDMLRKVPMVTVDAQDNITVNGSSSFKIYVDGKPNAMLSSNPSQILKMMPASSFKSVEVITNPGAKYDAEGVGGVLNFISDKSSGQSVIQDGYNASVQAQAGTRGDVRTGLYLTGQKGKFSISGNITLMHQNMEGLTVHTQMQNLDSNGDPASDLTSDGTQDQKGNGLYSNISASYEIDTLRLLTATFGMMGMRSTDLNLLTSSMTNAAGATLFSYDSKSVNDYLYGSYRVGLDYQRSFADVKGRTLTASYLLSTRPTDNDVFTYYYGHDSDRHSDNVEKMLEQTAQLDYTTPWGEGGTFSTGAKFISRSNASDADYYLLQGGDWVHDNTASVQFKHLNSIVGAYGEYSINREKWGGTAGVRYEHTFQQVRYLSGAGSDFDLDYGNLVPSASVQYNLSETSNLGLSYNLRISRPGIGYLNPYVDRSNIYSVYYGNVKLEAEKTHRVGLVWNLYSSGVMLNLTGRYSFCNNGISQYSFFDSDGVLNTTYGNIAREQDLGLNAYVNFHLGSKTRIFSNFEVGYVDISSETKGLRNGGWQFEAYSGLQQVLPWDLRLSLNLMYGSREYQLDGYTDNFSALMGSLTKSFLDDKLTVGISGMTGFGKGGTISVSQRTKGADYVNNYDFTAPIAQLSVNVSYRFGTSQNIQVKKAHRSIENDDLMQKSSGNGTSVGGGSGM